MIHLMSTACAKAAPYVILTKCYINFTYIYTHTYMRVHIQFNTNHPPVTLSEYFPSQVYNLIMAEPDLAAKLM